MSLCIEEGRSPVSSVVKVRVQWPTDLLPSNLVILETPQHGLHWTILQILVTSASCKRPLSYNMFLITDTNKATSALTIIEHQVIQIIFLHLRYCHPWRIDCSGGDREWNLLRRRCNLEQTRWSSSGDPWNPGINASRSYHVVYLDMELETST